MAGAAFVAWLGAALIVLSDARRGLALGLALLSAGLAVLTWPAGMAPGSVAIGGGGLIAAVQCWRSGSAAWGIMPAGSTPRLILCIASGLLAFWVSASVTTGPGGSLRFAAILIPGLTGARILMSRDIYVALVGIAALALALAAASGLAAESPGPIPAIVAGLIAAGMMFVPAAPIPSSFQASSPAPADRDGV